MQMSVLLTRQHVHEMFDCGLLGTNEEPCISCSGAAEPDRDLSSFPKEKITRHVDE
jgi:hypothetical protein